MELKSLKEVTIEELAQILHEKTPYKFTQLKMFGRDTLQMGGLTKRFMITLSLGSFSSSYKEGKPEHCHEKGEQFVGVHYTDSKQMSGSGTLCRSWEQVFAELDRVFSRTNLKKPVKETVKEQKPAYVQMDIFDFI